MLFEPLLEKYYAAEVSGPAAADGVEINNAVMSNSTHVWFNLVAAYPELAFEQILAQSWSSVVEKAWAVGRGDFDGNWAADWESVIFATWHNPEVSFLDSPDPDMMGSGPYKFSYWNSGTDYSVVRNVDYWDGWPAKALSSVGGVGDTTTLGGYIDTVTWRELASWTVRRGNFLAGTADESVVPRSYRDQVLGQIVGGEKIRNFFPVQPILSCNGFFFTFDIATTSLYMGTPLPPGTFGTNGIPPDIFSDILTRKGFAYAFNYANYLALAFLNEGTQPADPIVPGLAYDNVANNKYVYDINKAEYYLKLSWGGVDARSGTPGVVVLPEDKTQVTPGALWNNGMKFQTVYNIGNVPRELASVEIANEINTLNPSKFFIETLGLDWGTQVLPAMVASELPMFHIGWLADYADPHDFVFPFQHSLGTFSQYQRYGNAVVDALVVAGIATPDDTAAYNGELDAGDPRPLMTNWREETDPQAYIDDPIDSRWPRRAIYYALQALWFDDLPTILYLQGLGRHFEQAWTKGWYYNSLYPGGYYYQRWKTLTHFGDVSSSAAYGRQDGAIDTFDASFVSAHWSSPVSLYGYHPTADINGGIGATTGGLTGPIRGMPDGKVDIVDLGLISAYWDNPLGPSHP
jgi:peptide/nickel transport system substrate-binding protein